MALSLHCYSSCRGGRSIINNYMIDSFIYEQSIIGLPVEAGVSARAQRSPFGEVAGETAMSQAPDQVKGPPQFPWRNAHVAFAR